MREYSLEQPRVYSSVRYVKDSRMNGCNCGTQNQPRASVERPDTLADEGGRRDEGSESAEADAEVYSEVAESDVSCTDPRAPLRR